MIRASNRDLV